MSSPEPTILTRWGRLTGTQWLQRRYQQELAEWLTDEALHYIYTRTPYMDAYRQEIIDYPFRDLLETDPQAAQLQLAEEENQYLCWLAQHLENRKQENTQLDQAKAEWIHSRHRRGRKKSASKPKPRATTKPSQLAIA
ncbi:MAG: hypothetical protein LW834_06695 [Cyanobium sp. 49614_E6]|jgi:hypothetical protein|nr:hypothetical protein [Cyanobium sp. 49614_E6]MCE2836633.1 hypothetical protein [Cyanobium sp. 49614_E6]